MYRVKVTQPNNLLSVRLDREVTLEEAELVEALLEYTKKADETSLDHLRFLFNHDPGSFEPEAAEG